jgi:choline dehydrogenase-like flavoprotein
MFIDAREVDERRPLEADLCVVGTGAAGLPLALKLAGTPLRVLLLESGGLTADRNGQRIYRVVDDRPPRLVHDARRTWFFGGNTNHWFGNCRPLDAADFTTRDWIPYSGWPICRDDLLPYYAQAQELCGLGDFRYYDAEECRPYLPARTVGIDPTKLIPRVAQTCAAPSFGQRYRQRIEQAENLRVCLHARALRLETNAGGDMVQAVTVCAANGRRFRVAARMFVLAAGGIENPRLLLCSNDVNPNGLANGNDLVGRFFMEHPLVDIPLGGSVDDKLLRSVGRDPRPMGTFSVWPQLSLSQDLMRKERLNGVSLWFDYARLPWRASRAKLLGLLHGRSPIKEAWPSGGRMLREVREAALFAWEKLAGHPCLSVLLEQTPDPANRVRLSPQRDRFGQPAVELAFRLTDEDRERYARALRIVAAEVGLDANRLHLDNGRLDFIWHHMGTTRMHSDPKQGVVDKDCRVHAVANLFIAGSSVFPTGGATTPTLTIVALSLRLADHLLRQLA